MAKTKVKKGTNRNFTLMFLIILILLITVVIIYNFYRTTKITDYFAATAKVKHEANTKLTRFNDILVRFQLNPEIAGQVLPFFKRSKKVQDKTVSKLKLIKPPSETESYHKNLLRLYTESSKLSGDLADVATYLEVRKKLLVRFDKAVKVYSAAVKDAKTDDQIVVAARTLRDSVNSISAEMKKLKNPLRIYSSTALEDNLEKLSSSLTKIETAISNKDVNSLQTAVVEMKQLFSTDWSLVMVEIDKNGVKNYNGRVKELRRVEKKIAKERQKIR